MTTNLRERKKRETYLALCGAARELVQERGPEHVTVEDIATAANVSVRTFFNYFPSKEDAVVGTDEVALADLAEEIRRRPAGEAPVDVLRAVFVGGGDAESGLVRWGLRNDVVRRHPALAPRHLATVIRIQEVVARAFADRAGIDLAADHGPGILVAAALGALLAAAAWWDGSDRSLPLSTVLDAALDQVVPDFAGTHDRRPSGTRADSAARTTAKVVN